jgi:hypothetical protein
VSVVVYVKFFHILACGHMARIVMMVAVGMNYSIVRAGLIVLQLVGVILL